MSAHAKQRSVNELIDGFEKYINRSNNIDSAVKHSNSATTLKQRGISVLPEIINHLKEEITSKNSQLLISGWITLLNSNREAYTEIQNLPTPEATEDEWLNWIKAYDQKQVQVPVAKAA